MQRIKRDIRYLSVILILMISGALASCAPKLITPEIEHTSYGELKAAEPDCVLQITALEESPDNSDELVLDALFCYRSVWKHWENNYRVLDAKLGALNER